MEKIKQVLLKNIVWIAGALFLGFVLGRWLIPGGGQETSGEVTTFAQEWTCSMHPQIRSNEPGQCPICGMDLIALEEPGNNSLSLEMTEEAIKLGKIATTKVTLSTPEKEILLQGKVKSDERNISLITSRFPGRIEKLYVDFTGMTVKKGQKLASIYSPELVTAQQELLEAIKYKETNPPLYQAARNKLRLWNITDTQIDEIEQGQAPKTELDVLAPVSGVVKKRQVSLGEYVKEGTPLFELVDLSRVWILFEGYESDLPWIKVGDKIEYTVSALPGESYTGRVKFIDPTVNPATRSVGIRLETSNPGRKLKPEMFTNGRITAQLPLKESALSIPKSSVLWTGKRSVVYVKVPNTAQPTFEFREVVLGPDLGSHFVVESGLEEGEEIVSNGTFQVDAAAQLAGKRSMMNDPVVPPTVHSLQVPNEFREQLTQLFQTYNELKNALVDSDPELAKRKAKTSLERLEGIKMHDLDEPAHEVWMDLQPSIKSALISLESTTDLEQQRKTLIPLSEAMGKAIEVFGIEGITVYKDYCPMADGNRGAIWLSDQPEIRNPYFGEKMMKCGEVRKVYPAYSGKVQPSINQGHSH